MPRHYPAELRRQTCERMLAGEAVKDLVAELGISEPHAVSVAAPSAHRRRSSAREPRATRPIRWQAARRRIKELEAELKLVKAASALFDRGSEVSPKGSSRLSEG